VEQGHGEAVAALLGQGADPEPKDRYGDNALLLASARGNAHIVEALLRSAAQGGHGPTLEALFGRGAGPSIGTRRGGPRSWPPRSRVTRPWWPARGPTGPGCPHQRRRSEG
jgi:hypothetical protein